MLAKIYRPAKTAMQSGQAAARRWVLEFEPGSGITPDPLMGWSSSSDMSRQVKLVFETRDQAIAAAPDLLSSAIISHSIINASIDVSQ